MRVLYLSLWLILIFLTHSCKKEELVDSSALLGKWKLYDTYFSIGGPLIYSRVAEGNDVYLTFDARGRLSGTNTDYMSYNLKDSTIVTFIKKDKTTENYYYRIEDGFLNLSPAGDAMCIEGCGSRYEKIE